MFTGFAPIKPLPSIKEVVSQTQTLTHPAAEPVAETVAETVAKTVMEPIAETVAETVPKPAQESAPMEKQDTEVSPEPVSEAKPEQPSEDFAECWKQMVDVIFQKKPAFYHQLYDYLPGYENDVISVDVENEFQKNQLEMSKRAMLEYWRNHFRLNVDEIEFVIREHERKKVIYTSEDKVNNMLEQNPELKDFLQVLNFRIKD